MQTHEQRAKILCVSTHTVLDWFVFAAKSWRESPSFLRLPAMTLPADAKVVSVHANWRANTIEFFVESGEYPVVELGYEPERQFLGDGESVTVQLANDKRMNLLNSIAEESSDAKQLLRDAGYGWSGLGLLETVKLAVKELRKNEGRSGSSSSCRNLDASVKELSIEDVSKQHGRPCDPFCGDENASVTIVPDPMNEVAMDDAIAKFILENVQAAMSPTVLENCVCNGGTRACDADEPAADSPTVIGQ